jgi:hypothetical protein
MSMTDPIVDLFNGDDGEKRQREEYIRHRKDRAREDRLRGLAMSSGGGYAGPDPGELASSHFGHLGSAIGAVNSAIDNEMDSRVAQAREARRMEHEKYLAQVRLQMSQKEQEGNIIRSLLNG